MKKVFSSSVRKCDGPFPHSSKPTYPSEINAAFRRMAIKKFPEYNWKLVHALCLSCKYRIEKDTTRPYKRRKKGRPVAKPGNSSGANATTGNSCSPEFREANESHSEEALYMVDANETEIQLNENELPFSQGDVAMAPCSQSSMPSCSQSSMAPCSQSSIASSEVSDPGILLEDLNIMLARLHIAPLTKTHAHRPRDLRLRWTQAVSELQKKFEKISNQKFELEPEYEEYCCFCHTLLLELSAKYKEVFTKEDRYKILTCMPGKYSAPTISRETGCTLCTAQKAFELRREHGVYSAPPPREGNPISDEIRQLVVSFYSHDDVSRPSPRICDTIAGPNETRIARRHMFLNQFETYQLFKEKNPTVKIGKSKFYEYRPCECVLPRNKPFHNVCLCAIHENFKFMYEATGTKTPYKDFIASILCDPVTEECAHGLCNNCPDEDKISALMNGNQDEFVRYKQWVRTDGADFNILTRSRIEFTEILRVNLSSFIEHDFIKVKQKEYIAQVKENLRAGGPYHRALMILVDFAQNYSAVIQDAIRSYHWSAKQVTVHPFSVTWFDGSYRERQYVVLSDELSHDADSFNSFKRKVVSQIKEDFALFNPKHICWISDGAGSQYKNFKNFCHLQEHYNDFNITAEWVFTATSHGKGACDRTAATVKSTTQIHSLKGNYITSSLEMFEFCKIKLGSDTMRFMHIGKDEVAADREVFARRYENALRVPGTRSYHHFIPTQGQAMLLGKTAGCSRYDKFNIRDGFDLLVNIDEIDAGDFVAFMMGDKIQFGMYIESENNECAIIQCMTVTRQNFRLRWPNVPIQQNVPHVDILMKLADPKEASRGNYFVYTDDQIQTVCEARDEWFKIRDDTDT